MLQQLGELPEDPDVFIPFILPPPGRYPPATAVPPLAAALPAPGLPFCPLAVRFAVMVTSPSTFMVAIDAPEDGLG